MLKKIARELQSLLIAHQALIESITIQSTKSLRAALLVVFFFIAGKALSQYNESAPTNAIINARNWESSEKSFALEGLCKFFDSQLLTPAETKTASGDLVRFPSLFKFNKKSEEGLGYGTYVLTVILPAGEHDLALAMPQIYSCYKLWVNGTVIATNGIVAKTKSESKPQWKPQTVSFQIQSDTLSLVLQVANFHHNKGGIKEPIYLGKASIMKFKQSVSETSKYIECISLFALGFFFLIVYIFFRRNKGVLYFSLLTVTWSVRSLFSNLYLFISLFPDFNWAAMVRIEYITLYLAMIWAILFLTGLFHNEANIVLKYTLVFFNILFTAFTISSEPRVFTQGLTVYLIVSGILLIYGAYLVLRAWLNERTGSGLLTISVVLGLNIFGYDIFVYEGFSSYDPLIFSAGYVAIFLLMGLALSTHVHLIKSKQGPTTMLTYDDLYKNQDY